MVSCDSSNPFYFYRCVLDGMYLNDTSAEGVIWTNCRAWGIQESTLAFSHAGGLGFLGGALIRTDGFTSGAFVSGGGLGDGGVLDYYTAIQGGYVLIRGDCSIRTIQVWDAPSIGDNPNGHAIVCSQSGHHATGGPSIRLIDRGGFPIFGNGGAGVGVCVGQSAQVLVDRTPNIQGAAGDFKLGSGGKARFFNETTGVYSAVIAETWAKFDEAQGGGFGGLAHNVSENSHMLKTVGV